MYGINIDSYDFILAVDCKDDTKSRFRIDEIDRFDYYKNEDDLCRNYKHVIYIIDSFLNLYANQSLLTFFKNLKVSAIKLKDSKDKDYIIVLTDMVKSELQDLMLKEILRNLIINDELKDLKKREELKRNKRI